MIQNKLILVLDTNILFYAFRYVLGRFTYAVDDVIATIQKNLENLPINDLIIMSKEITLAIKDKNAGDKYHTNQWFELNTQIEKIIKDKELLH